MNSTAPISSAVSPATAVERPSRAWLWVVAILLLQLSMWTAWLFLAANNKVQEVPLVTAR